MSFRTVGVLLGFVLCAGPGCRGDRPGGDAGVPAATARSASERGGVRSSSSAGPSEGYVLVSPLLSGTTYLIDRSGLVVHTWESDFAPGVSSLLLDSGHLLRTARGNGTPTFLAGGAGGRIEEFGWDGELIWEWVADTDELLPHHDIVPLPNDNVLLIAWERKARNEAIRAGRDPGLVDSGGLRPDCLLEIQPKRPRGGRVVWEWHVWDHLIQDRDPRLENYGNPSDHPELVNINASRPEGFTDEAIRRLKSLGYMVGGAARSDSLADFMHTNSVSHNPGLDQIALSVWGFNEVWILDHGTTTREAASHAGGRAGKGGDLLYRWGNPRAYGRGTPGQQRLFGPHDARWIPAGFRGAGHLTVFNNGAHRPGSDYSSVLEIEPPLESGGRYAIAAGRPFDPERPVWEYTASDKVSFFAEYLSGAHRLPNGNTLICDGPNGRLFEVTVAGRTVWEFENPFFGDAPNPHGDPLRSVFRATFIPTGHPALVGRDLRPLNPQPQRHASRRPARSVSGAP